ncbi:glycine-rich RNA-binding protein 10-like [Mangifera indica]|uniref:glycine-rich RNA-binding protein 10-like n=1 Tax=Mangifera indica TaxID=29780 RepID=UPI001CF9540A|nr:glycine-rich RNA-binding protein 10-like [Mangifera indica]
MTVTRAVDTDKETKEVDDSKYYCRRYGCCHWYGHRCERCCSSPEDAKLMNSDAMPQNSYQVNDMKSPDGENGGWYGGGGYGGGGHGGGGHGGGGHGGWHGGSGYGGGGHGGGGHGEWHGAGGHGKGHGGGWSGGAASEIKP